VTAMYDNCLRSPAMVIFGLAALMILPRVLEAACFGASFETPGSNFEYQVHLGNTTCDLSNTNVTALYMLGSCCRGRHNNFGPRPPTCGPGDFNIMDSASDTCVRVFSTVPRAYLRRPRDTSVFDRGTVCSDGLYSVVFVQTDCDTLTAGSVVLNQRRSGADFCWSGHTMSQGKLAGIIVGGLAAAALLVALPVACCLWRLRRQQRNGLVDLEEQCRQPSPPPQQLQIIRVGNSVFVSKQHALSSPFYAWHLQRAGDAQPYQIELPPDTSIDYERMPSLPLASLSWTDNVCDAPPRGARDGK